MEVTITALVPKGRFPSEAEVKKTFQKAFALARKLKGKVIDGRGFARGTQLTLLL